MVCCVRCSTCIYGVWRRFNRAEEYGIKTLRDFGSLVLGLAVAVAGFLRSGGGRIEVECQTMT